MLRSLKTKTNKVIDIRTTRSTWKHEEVWPLYHPCYLIEAACSLCQLSCNSKQRILHLNFVTWGRKFLPEWKNIFHLSNTLLPEAATSLSQRSCYQRQRVACIKVLVTWSSKFRASPHSQHRILWRRPFSLNALFSFFLIMNVTHRSMMWLQNILSSWEDILLTRGKVWVWYSRCQLAAL